jgi:hypothetical protein
MIRDPAATPEPAHVPAQPAPDGAAPGPDGVEETVIPPSENKPVDLARIAWLMTVLASSIAVVILTLQGYYGYAVVTLAVAGSAAINLT